MRGISAKTVLVGWELGSGFGHLTRLEPVCLGLVARGFNVVFAARDDRAAAFFKRHGSSPGGRLRIVRLTCSTPEGRKPAHPNTSLADVLVQCGFDDFGAVSARVAAWRALMQSTAPDLIVQDFAPGLALANRGRVPSVVVGNGYTIPPPARQLPPIAPWMTETSAASQANEQSIMATISRLKQKGLDTPIEFVSDLLHGDRTFVCTLAAFDPYHGVRASPTSPPYNLDLPAHPVPLDHRRRDHVFVYLPAFHRHLSGVLHTVLSLGLTAEVYVPGIEARHVHGPMVDRLTIHPEPVALSALLSRARLLIHHGGLGIAAAGLVSGTPQITLPISVEHTITAMGLRQFGLSAALPESEPVDTGWLATAMKGLLNDDDVLGTSQKNIALHRNLSPKREIERVLRTCQSYLGAEDRLCTEHL